MKKIMSALIAGTLTLTLLAPSAIAATEQTSDYCGKVLRQRRAFNTAQRMERKQNLINQEEIMELVKQYTPDLTDQYQEAFDQISKLRAVPRLDEESRQKMAEIHKQVKDGTLSREEAKEQLEALGFNALAVKRPKAAIDEAARQKMTEVRQKVKDGTLTKEQAREELGIPGIRMIRRNNLHSQLTEAVEAKDETKITSILTQMLAEMQKRLP